MSDKTKPDFWDMEAELDIEGLLDALSHEDKMIRRRAATGLQSIKAIAAIDALRDAHKVEDDPETGLVIASAIQVLTHLAEGRPSYAAKDGNGVAESRVERLVAQLSADESEKIIKAARALGALGDKTAVEGLIIAFNNQKLSIHVRLAIAEALLKLESAPVEVALLANLRHTDWHIRRNGAAILGQLRAEWAIEPLARALKDPHPVVRRTALAALKHIGTPESRKALAQHAPSGGAHPAARKTQEMPRAVSGIEIKRPRKQLDDADAQSALLARLEDKKDTERANKSVTSTLRDPSIDDDETIPMREGFEPTQPISDGLLNDLDALLDEDLDD